jgi:chondroitin AC lyase
MKRNIQIITILVLLFPSLKVFCATSDIELLRRKVISELMIPAVDEAHVRTLIRTINPDGTWPGINYADVSNTGFQHRIHLANLDELSLAYKKKGSQLKGNAQLKKAFNSALGYWLANNFICENWWWNQIGTPTALVGMLLIMDTDLSKEQIEKTVPMVGRANLTATGARPSGDRIKIAGILAKTLLFKRDEVQFNEVIKVIEGEIKFSTDRGMQYDYSFHHRVDKVNNTLSYGTGYADAFAEWAAFVAGTRYQFSAPALHQLTDYYLDGICKMMVYGKYSDPGAMNRDITRPDANRAFGTAAPERLLLASDYRKNELEEIVKIRHGEVSSSSSHATFYWQSEHFSVQRPGYFTSVRMYSDRICNMEEPYNGEGLMNHHRGDGTNYISRTGHEYFDLSPVNDWQKIPGTTVVQKPALPSEKQIQKKGLTDFVGAVTDGKYGAAAFDFKSPLDTLAAKKSWFFFDKEYVCLGAGIHSNSKYPVATTVNQCLLRGDLLVRAKNQTTVPDKGNRELKEVDWVLQDGIGYIFPQPATVNLSNKVETGSWFRINHQSDSPKEEVSKEVFKLWFNHGTRPDNATYQYIVIPNTNEKELLSRHNGEVNILSNTTELQAVQHTGLNITEIVFYMAGQVKISGDLTIGIDGPGLLLLHTDGTRPKSISVEDPSRNLSRIHLTTSFKIDKKGTNFSCTWNEEKKITEIAIDLPQTVYAGKSVTAEL